MKERPIIFSGEMVRAILDGRKTQTRRVVNKLLSFGNITEFGESTTKGYSWQFRDKRMLWNDISHSRLLESCPHGQPGDRLWVRETWNIEYGAVFDEQQNDWHIVYRTDLSYCAAPTTVNDDEYSRLFDSSQNQWRPSIHMPRWASRMTLEISDIRVERVRDISEDDVFAEGIRPSKTVNGWATIRLNDGIGAHVVLPQYAFHVLWDSINAKRGYGWDVNPWVWVIEFKVSEVKGVAA